MLEFLGLCAGFTAVAAIRLAFVSHSRASQVDQYYWLLAARAYRKARRLPAVIKGKYLLEEERQAYPPFFGAMLAQFTEERLQRWGSWLPLVIDGLVAIVLGGFLVFLGSGLWAILAAIGMYMLTPVLVTYNAQLNPRVLGQLFLAASLLLQVVMVSDPPGWLITTCWAAAVVSAAMVVLTHKMTTQLMLFLWPWWAAALGSWPAAAVPPAAVLLAVAITGPAFARYQWQAHWDIVGFWFRNWRFLGAHLFKNSPIYGNQRSDPAGGLHHVPGMRGCLKHCRTIAAYAPANLLLPFLLLLHEVEVPAWLLVWFFGSYAFALLTLFVPWLRCLGSGYLYVYNTAVPGAIWWAIVVDTVPASITVSLLVPAIFLTALSLWQAWRIIGARPSQRDADFEALVVRLAELDRGRVAVFPLTAAEAVAFKTPHAVLWGGHGYGLKRLEDLHPVLRRPVSRLLNKHGINYILWNSEYWPDAVQVLANEGIKPAKVFESGKWRLTMIRKGRATTAEDCGGCVCA